MCRRKYVLTLGFVLTLFALIVQQAMSTLVVGMNASIAYA